MVLLPGLPLGAPTEALPEDPRKASQTLRCALSSAFGNSPLQPGHGTQILACFLLHCGRWMSSDFWCARFWLHDGHVNFGAGMIGRAKLGLEENSLSGCSSSESPTRNS